MKKCVTCGRMFVSNVRKKFTCPNCNQPVRVDGLPVVQTIESRTAKHFRLATQECNICDQFRPGQKVACESLDCTMCKLSKHIIDGNRCPAGKFPSMVCRVDPEVPSSIDDVQLVTVHYNPTRAARLAETYYEWRDSLGDLADNLKCYELVFDDHPSEIEGSIVLRAESSRSLMWQKEALLNRALRDCDRRYFAWLDHDICIQSPTWLVDALRLLDGDAKAVQLFSEIKYLTRDYKKINTVNSRVAGGKSAPGGAWIADADYLRSIGGFYSGCVVGAGDEWTYSAMSGAFERHMVRMTERMSDGMKRRMMKYFRDADGKPENVAHVDSLAYHLWHGDRKNRQYQTREEILSRHDFDPSKDIRERPDGVLEWASNKPQMHAEIRQFFIDRKDDG